MKAVILHLTDLHFTKTTDILNKVGPLCQVLKNELYKVDKLYVVVSGDLAYSGLKEEFDNFNKFLSPIVTLIKGEFTSLEVLRILVPGNHDCDFSNVKDLRKLLLKNVNYNSLGEDDSVIDTVLSCQDNFWNYYRNINELPSNKLAYSITDNLGDYRITFNCYNTSWMSTIHEKAGTLFFPVKRFETPSKKGIDKNINIGVWHHPYNWFNPSTEENNKLEFEHFTQSQNQIMLFGHEHESLLQKSENVNSRRQYHLISGKVFSQDNDSDTCGFNLLTLNLEDETIRYQIYIWNKQNYFNVQHSSDDKINISINRKFQPAKGLTERLNEINLPILSNLQRKIKLTDLFVFPDMEKYSKLSTEKLESYIDSSKLLSETYNYCVLDGDSQIGKSSLLKVLFLRYLGEGKYPLLLNANDIGKDLNRTLQKCFEEQYEEGSGLFDLYSQIDKSLKVILIDDFSDYKYSSASAKDLVSLLKHEFGKVILTVDSTHSLLPMMQTELSDMNFFTLKDFGYKKRNSLIEKYHIAKLDENDICNNKLLEDTKGTFNNINNMLGNKLVPAYPIFILSLVQALEYKPLNQNETSYGYCYQTLLHYSLHSSGVKNEQLDGYLNFLTELAYEMVKNRKESVSITNFEDFYAKYKTKFIIPTYNKIFTTLKNSKIIHEKEEELKFGYKYILYYLAAKKYSDILHTKEGKDEILKLFNEIYNEDNANILVFITHHSKDISFIEDCLINSMTILENVEPITLEKDDEYYKLTEEVAKQISNSIIDSQRNPREEREENLQRQDQHRRIMESRLTEEPDEAVDETEKITLPFYQSYRSIELIGQIIRNRTGSLERERLFNMVEEVYTMAFRTIAYLGEIFKDAQQSISDSLASDIDDDYNLHEIREKINLFIQAASFKACLGVFGKLIHYMGNKDLKDIFNKVSEKFNTPAAKLVTFSINSYYGEISVKDIKQMNKDFASNIVATNIFKSRIKSYVYNKDLDFKTKQQIASAAGFKLDQSKKSKVAS